MDLVTPHLDLTDVLFLILIEFAAHFETQNAAIASGSIIGQNVSIVALGINNGWFDSAIQEKAYIDFAFGNSYQQMINQTFRDSLIETYTDNCLPELEDCANLTSANAECEEADSACREAVDYRIYETADETFDVYDIRAGIEQPPQQYYDYLLDPKVLSAIGAKSLYTECSSDVSDNFGETGDGMYARLQFIQDSYSNTRQPLDHFCQLFRL